MFQVHDFILYFIFIKYNDVPGLGFFMVTEWLSVASNTIRQKLFICFAMQNVSDTNKMNIALQEKSESTA